MNKKYIILIILFSMYSCSLNKDNKEEKNNNDFEVINVKIEDNKEVESW